MSFPGLGGKKRTENKKTLINRHEKQLAKKLGGRRQMASGATAKEKGDIKLPELLVDSKETIENKITITAGQLAKIQLEAQQLGRYPALALTLKVGLTTPPEWIMIPLDYWEIVQNRLKELDHVKRSRPIESRSEEAVGEAD